MYHAFPRILHLGLNRSLSSTSQQDRERIGWAKVRKPVGRDRDNLASEAKLHAQAEQNKEFIQ